MMCSKENEANAEVSSQAARLGHESVAQFFEKEVVAWRSKMIKAFGDLHPYNFYITSGHDFEDMILKGEDIDAVDREHKKSEPFRNLEKMYQIDKKAEEEFHELLSQIENEKLSPTLDKVLQEQKKECALVFDMFDKIVTLCKNYFELEYSDCRKRVQKQMTLQKPMISEVERFLLEVEETGNKEINSVRESIAKWMYELGSSMLSNVDDIYNDMNQEPYAMAVWFECSESLTSKDVRNAFLTDQKEMTLLWKKAFDDLLMLSTELEKYRCSYNLTKSKLEREIFWMSTDYKENMPELTKIQRHLAFLVDRKVELKREVKLLEAEVKSEQSRVRDIQAKLCERIINTRMLNNMAYNDALIKFQNVYKVKKAEVLEFHTEITKGDQLVFEEILNMPWIMIDLSVLETEDDAEVSGTNDSDHIISDLESVTSLQSRKADKREEKQIKEIKTLHEDKFADAFRILISSADFVTLLNDVADELGYILDFSWVDYVKETLEIVDEIKWMELFKVFKINFVEDLKELKKHMMSYCKLNSEGQVVFDISGATDGLLHFVWLKRQSATLSQNRLHESESVYNKEFWCKVLDTLPKTLLWDSVLEVLQQYWMALQIRSNLLTKKLNLVTENEQLEKCIQNYYDYGAMEI